MAKRDNGTGCIYKTSRGWAASIQIGKDPNGKPIRKQFSAKTEREVKKKLADFQKIRGIYSTTQVKQITVEEYFQKWLTLKNKQLKPLSYNRLSSTINTHIIPKLGFIQFSQLTTADIQELLNQVSKCKSLSTVQKIYKALNALYSYDLGLPPEQRCGSFNPCCNILMPKCHQNEKNTLKIFSNEELLKIKKEISRVNEQTGVPIYPYGLIYLLVLNTGLRIGELLALNKEDIDTEKQLMYINKNAIQIKNENGKGYHVVIQNTPKTFAGNRVLSLNRNALDILQELYVLFPHTEAIALNTHNNRVTPQNAEKTFTQILNKCKIDSSGRKCHALRHTFATKLFEQGVDVKIVSQILGHSSSAFTRDTYITVIQQVQANAMNLIPELNI
jgi:integrase